MTEPLCSRCGQEIWTHGVCHGTPPADAIEGQFPDAPDVRGFYCLGEGAEGSLLVVDVVRHML